MKTKTHIIPFLILAVFGLAATTHAYTFTPIVVPGSVSTHVSDISGNVMVGYYNDGTSQHGFIYNGTTYSSIQYEGHQTFLRGTNGTVHVGYAHIDGNQNNRVSFTYDGSNFTVFSAGDVGTTMATDIDAGGNIVGSYLKNPQEAFRYNGSDSSFSYFNYSDPNFVYNQANGVDGQKVVGVIQIGTLSQGFLRDGEEWTLYSHPDAGNYTGFEKIQGDTMAGMYVDNDNRFHGFVFDGTTWTTIDHPNAGTGEWQGTSIISVDGNNLVGAYLDNLGAAQSFMVVIPEPSSILLSVILLGSALFAGRRRFSR